MTEPTATVKAPAAATPQRPARTTPPWRLLTILVLAVLVGLAAGRFASTGEGGAGTAGPALPVDSSPTAAVARLQTQLRAQPDEPRLLTRLGLAELAAARETADPSGYGRAEAALTRADTLAPGQADTLTGLGTLALARHDFRGALDLAGRALAATPDATDPLAVLADAQVELGRYDEATATVQTLVDRKPALASLSRVSYLRELHGDHDGAVEAMEQAATAGAAAPAERAYVRALLGDLHLGAGDLDAADASYRLALREGETAGPAGPAGPGTPGGGYALAEVGLARVAAARDDLDQAAERLRVVVSRRPEPASVALLGDVEAALGDKDKADRQYQLVRAIEALNRANGVEVDLELARFEADQARAPGGDKTRAVALARAAAGDRPTVYAADTLAWALRQAGKPREALRHAKAATRLGTTDAMLWYHLAVVEHDLGRDAAARQHLTRSFTLNPYLTVRDLPAARSLADRLGVQTGGES